MTGPMQPVAGRPPRKRRSFQLAVLGTVGICVAAVVLVVFPFPAKAAGTVVCQNELYAQSPRPETNFSFPENDAVSISWTATGSDAEVWLVEVTPSTNFVAYEHGWAFSGQGAFTTQQVTNNNLFCGSVNNDTTVTAEFSYTQALV